MDAFYFFGAVAAKDGYTVKKISKLGNFFPTDCRTFKTWDEADKAARFMAAQSNKIDYLNMR